MGRRGPLAKESESAQGHRDRTALATVSPLPVAPAPAKRKIPTAPKGLSTEVRSAWRRYWNSDVAQVAMEVDLPVTHRLFRLYDRYDRAMRESEAELLAEGSTGQLKIHPMAEYALKLEPTILRLENELGLTPLARARLGIATGQAALTLDQLNSMVSEEPRDNHRTGTPADPALLEWDLA